MSDQSHYWSAAAGRYEQEFIDPYRHTDDNPLLEALAAIPHSASKVAADLGCGIGPLLPILAGRFRWVHAIDFAPGMLERARERCNGIANIEFHQANLTNLTFLRGEPGCVSTGRGEPGPVRAGRGEPGCVSSGSIDVAVAVNSLVQPTVGEIEAVLTQVRTILRPGGVFLGIVPAMDAVHYHTMLLVDRARASGMPEDKARQNAARHGEHELYDFTFSKFGYLGLRQHFWQPFEIGYRLTRAGFRHVRKAKIPLDWDQFACAADLRHYPPPWDWFFSAEV